MRARASVLHPRKEYVGTSFSGCQILKKRFHVLSFGKERLDSCEILSTSQKGPELPISQSPQPCCNRLELSRRWGVLDLGSVYGHATPRLAMWLIQSRQSQPQSLKQKQAFDATPTARVPKDQARSHQVQTKVPIWL